MMRLRGVRRLAILATACALSILACGPSAGAPAGRGGAGEGVPGAAGRAETTDGGTTDAATARGLSAGGAAPGAPRHKARIAYVAQTTNMGVIDLAKQTGMFERYGVDAELSLVRNPLSVTAMLSGEVDFNFTGAHPIITANVEGADTVLVACGLSTPTWHIFGSRAITSTQDLRGARVATSRRGADLYSVFLLALPRWGLGPDDVTTIQIDSETQRVAAVLNDAADATVTSVPANLYALREGLRLITSMAELGISWPASCLASTRRFAVEQPLALKGVLQGYVATIQWMRDNREQALDLLERFTESDDRALVEEAYETTLKYQQPVPYPPPEGVRTILSTIGTENAAALPPERFIEDRVLRELDASGFVRSLAP
jgi:NitT/TauT family transport system substrate-binding protein